MRWRSSRQERREADPSPTAPCPLASASRHHVGRDPPRTRPPMNDATADFTELLDCLADRLPALRQALLAQPASQLEKVEVKAGERLLNKGEAASAVYVIATGAL